MKKGTQVRRRHAPAALSATGRAPPRRPSLLAVKFDDELLVDRAVNVVAHGPSHHARAHLALGGGEPVGPAPPGPRLPPAPHVRAAAARLLDARDVAAPALERGYLHLAPVHPAVRLVDELALLTARPA